MSTIALKKHRNIPIKNVSPSPFQTRIGYSDIEPLAQNINEYGLQQPIIVRKLTKRKYELISGARRLEATRILGWEKIPASIMDVSDVDAAALCLSENLQRANLNPIEEARGYKMLVDEFNMTHEEVAVIAGKSRPYITNSLSLLKLDPFLQACLLCGKLTLSHVRIINMAPDEIPKYRLADIVMDWNLTVSELKDLVKRLHERRMILFWTREIPIENIKIPTKAFTSSRGGYESGIVIIDTRMTLIGGLERVMNARKNREKTVEAEVVYFSDWLRPSESWTLHEPLETQDTPSISSSRFSQVLAELMEDPEEMTKKYPVHSIKRDEDYFTFLARAR